MIEIEGITKRYGDTNVVDDVSMVVEPHTVAVIVGTSGSGKTTLLRMINRLVEPTSGSIRLDGADNRSVPGYELRRSIGYAIQGHGLFPHRTVIENLELAQVEVLKRTRAAATERSLRLLERVGLADQASKYPAALSGGQQQRVAIARALAMDPVAMLLPTLDSTMRPSCAIRTSCASVAWVA